MQTPAHDVSPNEVARIGQIHLDRMAPIPELEAQVQRFTGVQAEFLAAANAWRTALSAARSAQTQRDEMCQALINLLYTIKTAVLNSVHRRRKSDLVTTYFPPTGVVASLRALKPLVATAEDLLAKLEGDSDPAMTDYVDPLATALTNAKDAIRALDTARAAARTARGLLDAQRNDWKWGYRHDFYDLSLLYSAIPGRAESFFWHPGAVAAPANPPAPVAAPGSAPACANGNGGEAGKSATTEGDVCATEGTAIGGNGGDAPAIGISATRGNGDGVSPRGETAPGRAENTMPKRIRLAARRIAGVPWARVPWTPAERGERRAEPPRRWSRTGIHKDCRWR